MDHLKKEQIQWRTYQARVLANVEDYLDDQSIHLIAPPGSGKTLLGVGIIHRLQKKTLVLVPSLILKEQWLTALRRYDDLLKVSDELLRPTDITVTTYQELYSKKKEEPMYFEEQRIQFLVLDEAHHLKSSWSDALLQLKMHTPQLQTLSLTATPPFDANRKEWQRYLALNGEIDEEISVSELIKEQVLAPYQDYVYLVSATAESNQKFEQFLLEQNHIVQVLCSDSEVTEYLLQQSFLQTPLEETAFIYKNFDYYLSCLFYLNEQGYTLKEEHWTVLGLDKRTAIPEQTKQSLRDLYSYLFKVQPDLEIFNYLKKKKWLYEDVLHLFPEYTLNNEYKQNIPQLKEAISHIVVKEESYLKQEFSCVIFMDRIKKEVLQGEEQEWAYGVVPTFLDLKELLQPQTELAAICGEFLLISYHIGTERYSAYRASFQNHPSYEGYYYLPLTERNKAKVLVQTTELLDQKVIQVLVGTISLLGEGWNCPAVNTVILGNRSSSYVQTQQIRGRGLRKTSEDKLTNIWHLGLVFPNIPLAEQPDLFPITRRLSYIEGINNIEELPLITTGSERFGLPQVATLEQIDTYTYQQLFIAKERKLHLETWQTALLQGTRLSMPLFLKETTETTEPINSFLSLNEQPKKGFWASLTSGELASYFSERRREKNWRKKCQQKEQLLEALSHLLREDQLIKAEDQLEVIVTSNSFRCELKTASYHNERLFVEAAKELLGEIEEPRYLLLVGENRYAIPERYGKKKQEAERFLKEVQKRLPTAATAYTKNPKGRKLLIEGRLQTLTNEKKETVIQRKIWH
ncbi:DEAD/DEAH box helicase family protein [uncultured Enterococcus sp.]|uniref:DEAD/DEAH box helicase family protein n=1 Tax=uncultured Enterococcus sp. TaxID=167972 RepID=UPI002AA83F2A|nr:DEAD/DEAH box helicase family protein [uncultured Enterococcus sp.]